MDSGIRDGISPFRAAVVLGVIPGIYIGVLIGLMVAGLNFLWESPRDVIVAIFWFGVIFGAIGAVASLIVALLAALLKKSLRWTVFSVSTVVASVFIFIEGYGRCYGCHQFLDWRAPHLIYTPGRSILLTAALALGCIGVGAGIGGIVYVLWGAWRRRFVRRIAYFVLIAVIAIAISLSYLSTPGRGEHPSQASLGLKPSGGLDHVIVIVDDAATWTVFDYLLKNGSVPALRKIVENGSTGYLKTFRPTHSPQIWTTMATGRSPTRHAITGFINYAFPGMRYGIANFEIPFEWMLEYLCLKLHALGIGGARTLGPERRRVKALWNIASDLKLGVGVVNWHNTLPAEKVEGFMLSNYFYLSLSKRANECVYPADLIPEVEDMVAAAHDSSFDWVTGFSKDELPGGSAGERADLVRKVSNGDFTANLVSMHLHERFKPALMMMGLKGLDTIGHTTYWEYALLHYPQEYKLTPYLRKFTDEELIKHLGKAIDNLYILHDRFYRQWLDMLGGNDAIIIVSDHGFEMNGNQHEFGPPGVIMLYGKPFKKGYRIENASVFDIAPTVLYLLGLAVGEDMEGKILTEALDPQWLSSHPIRTIDTYETVRRKHKKIPRKVSEETLKRLKAVGYIR